MAHLSENVTSNRKADDYLYESDHLGEVIDRIDSRGLIARDNRGKAEKGGLTEALEGLSCSYGNDEPAYEPDGPHEGFFFVLPYVDLKSLLTLERVSKSIRSRVNDVLVWTKLLVEPPLSKNLSDERLLSLVKRTKGHLKSIILVECLTITHEMLGHVLSLCPRLEKLCVPGCFKLSIEAIVNMVELHAAETRAKGLSGIKQLRVRGLFYMTEQHLNALRTVVLSGGGNQARRTEPMYFNEDPMVLVQNERPIDVEICPQCRSETPVMVYDCTREKCQELGKLYPSKACRGCTMCIPRCFECGVCFLLETGEKTCCSDMVCQTCWLKLAKCAECYNPICRKHQPTDQKCLDSISSMLCEGCLIPYDWSEYSGNDY